MMVFLSVMVFLMGKFQIKRLSLSEKRNPFFSEYFAFYVVVCSLLPALLVLGIGGGIKNKFYEPLILESLRMDVGFPLKREFIDRYVQGNFLPVDGNILKNIENDSAMRQSFEVYKRKIILSNIILNTLTGIIFFLGSYYSLRSMRKKVNISRNLDRILQGFLFLCAGLAILTTVGIVLSLFFEAFLFFQYVAIKDFLFSTHWSFQSESYGMLPLLVGTLLISSIAMCVATPLGLLSAIYLSEYASIRFRSFVKPVLEILAGIPTVVYGFFAITAVGPGLQGFFSYFSVTLSGESALTAGIVMGMMIVPFILSLSNDVIMAVPKDLREGSYGLGATKSETIMRVVIPAAFPGIMNSILLGFSRAIGETMIVVMAVGMSANLTFNPLEGVTTITVQIVQALVGDNEFGSPKTLVVFALGLVLFFLTWFFNMVSLIIAHKYREQYD